MNDNYIGFLLVHYRLLHVNRLRMDRLHVDGLLSNRLNIDRLGLLLVVNYVLHRCLRVEFWNTHFIGFS